MATIVHFDVSATNPDRVKKFYENLFGWKVEPLPGPMNYSLVETTDLKGNKSLGGGIAKREKTDQPGIVNFIGVKSIDESLVAVEKLGGKIIQPKQAVPGWGHLAVCLDTEDNRFGLFQEA
jgi:predicted enzyme related to lactoylglutathione lyase